MNWLSRFKVDLLFILLLLLLPLALFWDVTLGGQTMLPVDNLYQWAPWTAVADTVGPPQNPLISDLIIQNYVWKQFVLEHISSPTQLLWNPNLFAGVPFLAAGQHSAYYPFSLLFLLLPLSKAYGWFAVSQVWLAGIGMYLYGRVLGLRRPAAFLAALTYQGGGFIVVSAAVFPMVIGAVAWLPWLLAAIDKVITHTAVKSRLTWPWMMFGSVVLACQLLAGHIEFTIYTLLVMAAYAAWRLLPTSSLTNYRHWFAAYGPRPLAPLAGMVLLGLMLGALQLIPLYELGQTNFREASASLAEVQGYGFPKRRILTLALPNFFGNPAHQSYVDAFSRETLPIGQNSHGQPRLTSEWDSKNYVEGGIYLAILPLFLAALGLIQRWRSGGHGRRLTLFYLLLALFSLAFIFGTPLYALLYYGLPFVNQLHTPFRWVFPFSTAVAVLAGFGADFMLGSVPMAARGRAWLRPFTLWGRPTLVNGLAGLAFWGGTLLLLGLFGSWLAYEQIEPALNRIFLGLALAPDTFPHVRAFYSYQLPQLLHLGGMLLGTAVVLRLSQWERARPWVWLLATLLIIVDIWQNNHDFHASNDPALLAYQPQLVQWLQAQPGDWRLTSFTPQGDTPFHANSAWMFGLADVRGYDSIIPKQYTQYMAAIEPQGELLFNRIQPLRNWESLHSPLLNLLGVRYVITTETIDQPPYQLAWEGEGVRVYENLAVWPRAYTLPLSQTAVAADPLAALNQHDLSEVVIVAADTPLAQTAVAPSGAKAGQPAQLIGNSNIEVTVQTAVTEPSWLILNDSYFPGWKGYIKPVGAAESDEQQVDIYLVNGNFRGIQLPAAGEWQVRFRYSPVTFHLGGLASAMALVTMAFGTAVWLWQYLYRPTATPSKTHSIAKNSLAPMALNLFNKFIDFVFAMFYLRLLGPVGAGSFQTAIVTAGIFDIVANYGLDILFIRDVSADRRRASHYLFNTTVLRIGIAFIAALPVFVLIFVTNNLPDSNPLTEAEIMATILIMVGMIFSGMSKGITGLFYIHEEAETPAAMTTATTIMKVGFGVVVLLLGYNFMGLAAVSILTNLITLLILTTLALKKYHLPGPWQLDMGLQRQMMRHGFPLMLIHLLQTVFISTDTYLLRVMLPDGKAVAGWYSSAYRWFNALQIIPSFFTLALFPIITREIQLSMESAQRMYAMAIKIMYLLALPVAAVTCYMAYPLVQLVGGDEFLPHGAIALQIVIWSIPIGWMNSVTNYVLISLGLERIQPKAFAAGVLFNIVANLLFIPMFTYVAAGLTTAVSELVLLVMFTYYLQKRMPKTNWAFLVRPALTTAVTLLLMYLLGQIHLFLGLVAIIFYPIGLLLLQVIGPEERKILADILPTPIARRLQRLRPTD